MTNTRTWLKRAGLFLATLLASVVLLLGVLLVVCDADDYQRLLVWSADFFLDSELQVSGPLTTNNVQGLQLTGEGFSLHARDGSYALDVTDFSFTFQPQSIFTGRLWIDELSIVDLALKINAEKRAARDSGLDWPSFLVARARIDSLLVEYREAPSATLQRFTLNDLSIDDAGSGSQLDISANGSLMGQAFTVEGVLPPLNTLQDRTTPKPVRLAIVSEQIDIRLKGSIRDPLKGHGLELEVHASVDSVERYFELFANEIPGLGRFELNAMLRGDYAVPRLEDIDLRLKRGEQVDLKVSGNVGNLLTGDDSSLLIKGQSDNLAVLSWLLFRQQDRLSALRLSAGLDIKDSRYLLSDLDVQARTPEGLDIQLAGSGELYPAGHRFRRRDAGFRVDVRAPKTSVFRMANRHPFPDLGPVSGTAALAAGLDAVGLYDTDISLGSQRGTHVSLRGDLSWIPLSRSRNDQQQSLQLNIKSADLARLGQQFERDWPDLGQAELSGTVKVRDEVLRLENARFLAGHGQSTAVTASGTITTELNKGSLLDLKLDVDTAALLAGSRAGVRGDLGVVYGSIRISDMDGSWGLEAIDLASRETDLYQLKIKGRLDDLVRLDQGSFEASVAVEDPDALGKAAGMQSLRMKPVKTQGRLLVNNGKLNYRGSAHLGQTSGAVVLEGSLGSRKPALRGSLSIPLLYLADVGIGTADRPVEKSAGNAVDAGHVFSRDPIRISFLNHLDLELDLRVDELLGRSMRIDRADGHVSIRAGQLQASPLRLKFAGGHADLVLGMRDAAMPEYHLKIDADGLGLDSLLSRSLDKVPLRGTSSLHADVAATGRSLHQLASSLNGTINLRIENARMPRDYLTILSVDLLGWAGSMTLFGDRYTDLSCVIASFGSSDGVLTSNAFIADGPDLSLSGRIHVDLAKETLDVTLLPKQKKRVLASISPVKITGPIKKPVVRAIPARAALQEIGTLVLLPGVAVSLKVFEELWGLFDGGDAPEEGCKKLDRLGESGSG